MKATKQSKKVPKKVKRMQSFKDIIQEGFLALFGDDIKMHEQNLFELFALKSDENARLFLDLHTGKLYLHNGAQYLAVDYSELPDFLKNGGKGSGKYKHLNEKNWHELTDKQRAQEIFEQHYPSAVERVYPTGVTPPDFEAYYIKTANGVNEKSVYLRCVGQDHWRVFFAGTYTGALPLETYSCSEYVLRDLLTGKDRRSKSGEIDCCDRLLGIDEVQYLSAFMPNVHAAKRPKALACAEDESGALVTAYYWKGGKSVACADEDYVTGLFAALEEIARCSVLLEFPDQDEEPAPEAVEETATEVEVMEELPAAVETLEEPVEEIVEAEPEEVPAEEMTALEEAEAVEEPVSAEAEPETVAENTEENAEEAEAAVEEATAQENPIVEEKLAKKEKRGLFGRRKKRKKEVPAAETAESAAETPVEPEEIEAVNAPAAHEAEPETVEEAEPIEEEESAEEVVEEEPAEVPVEEAEAVEEPAEEIVETQQAEAAEVAVQDAEPAQTAEPVAEEKLAKKEKRGLFGHRKKHKKEVSAAVEEEQAETVPETAEQTAAEAEVIEELPAGVETIEEPAEEIVEVQPAEVSAEEVVEAESAEELAEETVEPEAVEEITAEVTQPEMIEEPTEEAVEAQPAEVPAKEATEGEEPAAVEEMVAEEADPETIEEPAEEVIEAEPVEEPAVEEAEQEEIEEPAQETVESEAETPAEAQKAPAATSVQAEQPEAAETPAQPPAQAPEHKPLRLKRQKKATKGAKEGGARVADYDLPQRMSAYAAAGKKKAIKKEIIAVLPDCPLIVPISAANIETDKIVYISKQASALCGEKIVPFVLMADKVPLLPAEENNAQRQGVMVKTVVNRGKTYIPVFADFKTAVRIFGTSEIFGVFTLKNILSHIAHNENVQGITINPGEVNLKLTKEDFEENE